LIFSYGGQILFNFGRLHVFGDKDLKRSDLFAEQIEALEILQILAKKHQIRLKAQAGDLTFVNNFAILHSRDAFEDTKEQSRHLVRLWLKNEALAWRLPPILNVGNQAVFYDDSVEGQWEIIPQPRLGFELRDKFGP
jgi:Taurine catabolism dioxygenase TauD, TfdA family